jgi:TolA-binding protein
MKYSKIYFLFLTLSPVLLFSAEPSAFGAGDLSSSTPYGLTKNEKVLLETEKKLKTVARKSNSQASQLDSLRERLDGLQSIVESLSRKAHNNKITLQNLHENTTTSIDNINEYQQRLGTSISENKQAIEELKTMISQLSKSIELLSADYVTKADYNTLVKDVNNFKLLVAKEMKKGSISKSKKSSITSAKLYNRAKSNFNKKRYTAAISDYEELIKRRYKPAYAHYMIGEMYFSRKNYAKAISYFKKSSSLYSKASYMPKLMLHTAIAMLKTGDKKHANAFFDAIVVKYPNSKEAREAKKYLGL